MASGTIRITNIPVSAGGYDYALGATATWSTTRSGNTVTVSGKVMTDAQGSYSFNSTYAINCTLVWGGDVKKNIVIKAADSGSSIFSRAGSYEQTFTNVPASQTTFNMRVIINHTNNSNSGEGSGTISFPVGYTSISYTKTPTPTTTTYPWRLGNFSWKIYKATGGTNNAVSKYIVYYRIYNKSNSSWGSWTKKNEFAASAFGSATYVTTTYTSSIPQQNAMQIKVEAVGKQGDTAAATEKATWATSLSTQGFQTVNTPPPAPTFDTASPLTAGAATIKVSAKDSSTAYYNNGNSYLKFSILAGTGYDWKNSATAAYTNTFSYSKNLTSSLTNKVGDNIEINAAVWDGIEIGPNTSKTYQYGVALTNFGGITFEVNEIPVSNNFTINIHKPKVDNYAYPSTKSVNYTMYISYSSSSGYKSLATGSITKNESGVILTKNRTDLFNILGAPANTSSKIYFKVLYSATGLKSVYSDVVSLGIDFINYTVPIIGNWDGSAARYRYNGGSPIGPCVANSVLITNLSTNVKYIFTIDSTSKIVTGVSSYYYPVNDLDYSSTKSYNIKYSAYEVIKNTSILLGSGTITNSSFYRPSQINTVPSHSLTLSDKNFLTTGDNNIVEGIYKLSVSLQVYKATIKLYLNDTQFGTYNINQIKQNSEFNESLTITATDSSSGYMPSSGYKITSYTIGNNTTTVSNGPTINVNETNILKIIVTIRELFAESKSTDVANYTILNDAFSTTLSKTLTSSLIATALPNVSEANVKLWIKQ